MPSAARSLAALTVCSAGLALGVVAAAPAAASAPHLPNPCKLLTVKQIDAALHKGHAQPSISHQTYQAGTAYEDKTCTWKYGSMRDSLDVYDKSGGSGGGPNKTTPEPSLGPNGELVQSTNPNEKFTDIQYKRHGHYVGIFVNRNVKPKRMLKLGKDAYNRT